MSFWQEAINRLQLIANSSMIKEEHDSFEFTYVAAGNGVGEVETVVYKLAGVTVATLTYTYNADNKVSTCVKTTP